LTADDRRRASNAEQSITRSANGATAGYFHEPIEPRRQRDRERQREQEIEGICGGRAAVEGLESAGEAQAGRDEVKEIERIGDRADIEERRPRQQSVHHARGLCADHHEGHAECHEQPEMHGVVDHRQGVQRIDHHEARAAELESRYATTPIANWTETAHGEKANSQSSHSFSVQPAGRRTSRNSHADSTSRNAIPKNAAVRIVAL